MPIGQSIIDFLTRFEIFNPHRVHGFPSGPRRSHFWLDLGWAYKDLKEYYRRTLRDPASATAMDAIVYLNSLQYY
jgi:hypothetical protein